MADVDGAVFMSDYANDTIGSFHPSEVIKTYLEDSLEHNNLTHDVTKSFDVFSIESHCDSWNHGSHADDLDCALDHFQSWVDGHSDEGLHFNLLLVRDDEYGSSAGGYAYGESADPPVAVSQGAEHIDNVSSPYYRYQLGYDHAWVNVALHEVCHNLGGDHDDGLVYEETFEEDRCNITPMAPDADNTSYNNCNTFTQDRDDYSTDYHDHYYYYDCTGAELRSLWG